MSRFYKFESNNYVNYGIQKSPKLGGQSVMLGQALDPSKLPPLVFEHNFPTHEPIPHFLTGGTVLASQALLQVFDSVGVENFQAIPVLLLNPNTNEKREDYFLFNVIGLVQAANLNKSSYDELMPGLPEGVDSPLVAFKELVIDSKRTKNLDLFRLAEEPVSIVVSDTIVQGLRKNKPDGGWGIVIEQLSVSS